MNGLFETGWIAHVISAGHWRTTISVIHHCHTQTIGRVGLKHDWTTRVKRYRRTRSVPKKFVPLRERHPRHSSLSTMIGARYLDNARRRGTFNYSSRYTDGEAVTR